jgi:flagellin-like protein
LTYYKGKRLYPLKITHILQESPAGGQNVKSIFKRKWKDDAVSPVIATILMVAITVVLAAVLYLLVSGLLGGGSTTAKYIAINKGTSADGKNWTIGFSKVDTGMAGNSVTLVIKDSGGTTKINKALNALSWGTDSVLYDDLDADGTNDVKVGEGLIIDKTTYPSGSMQLLYGGGVAASTDFV